ncbi:hypothetical protein A0H81_06279 [Grifola frondosa]|uniref:Fungal-type protein kinase domain-containing protein n=1 Tax=Grifola frondosa TaxID=5627 RepID=A0A1C7M9V8_GRIFR|nr:hypothetical protein A0H81_06279 [Grifola frondosa]
MRAQKRDPAEEQHEELDSGMQGKWCLLDADLTTLDLLLPLEPSEKQPRSSAYDGLFKDMEEKKGITELELSKAFASTVNDARDIFAPHNLLPIDIESGLKDPSKNTEDDSAYWWCSASDGETPHPELQRLWLKFKKDKYKDDVFDDDNIARLETGDEDRRKIRAELIAYAEAIMKQQQRAHLFSVLILGSCCRIFRWDRAGACVTRKFNYVKHPEILGEFLWRLSHSTAEMQGRDSSAVLVKPGTEEYLLMDQMARDGDRNQDTHFDYIRQLFAASLIEGWPRYKLGVEDAKRGMRYFLVGKPQFAASGLASRGTRSYVGIDVQDGVFVHLKDQWRYDTPNVASEGAVVERLNDAGARNVPTLVCHGDVRGQRTKTQDYWMGSLSSSSIVRIHSCDDARERCPPDELMHYRIVEKEVGKPLKEFKDSRALVSHVLDGVTAHEDAVMKAGILHRDVSADNLLIYPACKKNEEGVNITDDDWTGLLINWEFSKPISQAPDTSEEIGRNDRVGTWQFMSVHILNHKYWSHSIEDDLESFFYVLLYNAVRYVPNNVVHVDDYINAFFDERECGYREPRCGFLKTLTARNGEVHLPDDFGCVRFGSPEEDHPLNDLIDIFVSWLGAYYRVVGHDRPTCVKYKRTHDISDNKFAEMRAELRKNDEWQRLKEEERRKADGALATNLQHDHVGRLLKGFLVSRSWPLYDRSPKDQLGRDSSPSTQKQGGEGSNGIQESNGQLSETDKGVKRGPEMLEDDVDRSNKRLKSSPPRDMH